MRFFPAIAVIALVMSCLALGASAADAVHKRDRNWTPSADDPTVGVLGGPRKDAPPESTGRARAPSAPVAAPVPKVEAGSPTIPSTLSAAPALPVAPRPDAVPEGPTTGTKGPAVPSPAVPATPPTGFLPDHPFISGLVAGLVGTSLGEELYGGPMQGDETAVVVGYGARILLIVLLALLGLRMAARMMGGGGEEDYPPPPRRDPSFHRGAPLIDGRREPTLGGDKY